MSKRWTDEDVERLVYESGWYLDQIKKGELTGEYGTALTGDGLENALAPFRPDPEEALVEAMAKTYIDTCHHLTSNEFLWEQKHDLAKDVIRSAMRSTLAVIKEKGYFNDQR